MSGIKFDIGDTVSISGFVNENNIGVIQRLTKLNDGSVFYTVKIDLPAGLAPLELDIFQSRCSLVKAIQE